MYCTLYLYHFSPSISLLLLLLLLPLLLSSGYLEKFQLLYTQDPKNPKLCNVKQSVLRSLFTVGLFSKNFEMDNMTIGITNEKVQYLLIFIIIILFFFSKEKMSMRLFSVFIFFCNHNDEEIQIKALYGLGEEKRKRERDRERKRERERGREGGRERQREGERGRERDCSYGGVISGLLCVRYPEMMLRKETKELYLLYMSPEASMKMKCQVNNN